MVDFCQVIQRAPDFAGGYVERGQAYLQLGQLDRALWDFNQVLQIRSHDPYSYFDRGRVYLELKQFEKAIRDFDDAIQFKPHFAEAYFHRAMAYGQLNKSDQAEADLDAAEKLAKGSFPGQKPLKTERTEILEKITRSRAQLLKGNDGFIEKTGRG